MVYRSIRPEEMEAWVALCGSIFEVGPNYFRRHFLNDPETDVNGIFVAEHEGQLVSSVRVFTREIYLEGQRVAMGGIGEVCTRPEYRGQGVSAQLLKRAISYMEDKRMPVSMLFTGTNHHYAHQGWFSTMRRYAAVSLEGVGPLPEGYELRAMEQGDLAQMRGLYGLYAGRFSGPVVRTHPGYWDKWVLDEWKNPFVMTGEGRILCYLDAELNEERGCVRLREFAAAPETELLLPALGALARLKGWPLKGSAPLSLLPGKNDEILEDGGLMVRLNFPFELGGRRIGEPGQLARAFADPVFWSPDDF